MKHRRNSRMAKTQRKTKKMMKSIETKDDGDRDEYRRQQREHREGDINSNLENNNKAATSESLNNLGANQADAIEMRMPSTSIQQQQQRTPEEEFEFPVMNRADPFGYIPIPHEHDV